MSLTKHKHTIVLSGCLQRITGVVFERDWYSYEWVQAWDWRVVVVREEGDYNFVGHTSEISLARANVIVDAILQGKIQAIDLREYSVGDLIQRMKK